MRAATYGATAALMESTTPLSLDTPHTGGTNYETGVRKIPAACITREDAELLFRLYNKGTLLLRITYLPMKISKKQHYNMFSFLRGPCTLKLNYGRSRASTGNIPQRLWRTGRKHNATRNCGSLGSH